MFLSMGDSSAMSISFDTEFSKYSLLPCLYFVWQDVEVLVEEVQEAISIKQLHQPTKVNKYYLLYIVTACRFLVTKHLLNYK